MDSKLHVKILDAESGKEIVFLPSFTGSHKIWDKSFQSLHNTFRFVETKETLNHENAETMRVYVQRITVKTDIHRTRIAQRMKHADTK